MGKILASFVIAAGLIGFGFSIGQGLKKFNRAERMISVRGLAEREVSANVAVWKISFNVSSDRIDDVRKQLPEVQNSIQSFLVSQNFKAEEISKSSNIRDRQAQDYGGEKGNRFVATGSYVVTTNNVTQVEKSNQAVDDLLKKGIVMTGNQVEYFFTDLNQIKPEMLDEATKNAKEAAAGFAKSMDVEVGSLKSASQGVFSIENPIGSTAGYSEYGSNQNSSLRKKVRVVTQVEFYIE